MKKYEQSRKPKLREEKRRGPGRPPLWQQPLLALKSKTQFILAQNKSEAMTLYSTGGRMTPRIRVRVEKQPDGTYKCFRN
jgi:hypothetical protein